jgi:glutamate-1-semialdehyde 2,1-aminomutase
VYQAGTLSGNPLAMSAGLATLEALEQTNAWDRLEAKSAQLHDGLNTILSELSLPPTVSRVGSMLTLFFADVPVTDFEAATRSDTKRHARFFRSMLESGVHLPPSQYEAWFVSMAHEPDDLDKTLEAARHSLKTAFS